MIALLFTMLQTAGPLPDIELNAHVRARSLTIERRGEARLTVRTSPQGANVVDVRAPQAEGRARIPSPDIRVKVEARIADPRGAAPGQDSER